MLRLSRILIQAERKGNWAAWQKAKSKAAATPPPPQPDPEDLPDQDPLAAKKAQLLHSMDATPAAAPTAAATAAAAAKVSAAAVKAPAAAEKPKEKKPRVLKSDLPKNVNVSFCDIYTKHEAPKVLVDSQYPSWVWTLGKKEMDYTRMEKIPYSEWSDADKRRYFKQKRKKLIKEANQNSKFGFEMG